MGCLILPSFAPSCLEISLLPARFYTWARLPQPNCRQTMANFQSRSAIVLRPHTRMNTLILKLGPVFSWLS